MAKILHHNDDDGRCAAFITKSYIVPYAMMSPEDFIEYNHAGNLEKKYPAIKENETVVIVDIALGVEVDSFIGYVIGNGGNVIHIDHHASGIEYFEEFHNAFEKYIEEGKYKYFFKNGISGTMLCWIYSNVFNDEDRKDPMNARFDFDDDNLRNKCCRISENGEPVSNVDTPVTDRMIPEIPDVIRFIDDHDIFKHKITETRYFTNGFMLQPNKHPLSQIWNDIITNADYRERNQFIQDIIKEGEIILRYRNLLDAKNLSNGFYVNINGKNVAFLNTPEGNSFTFQDMYNYSDAVCKYSFDGEKYWFTFYSDENKGADCKALIEYLKENYGAKYEFITGGGHVHAAGSTWRKNFLELFSIDKEGFVVKRKQIRIDKEVAAEQKRIEEEQRKLKEDAEKLARIRAKIEARDEDEEDYGI